MNRARAAIVASAALPVGRLLPGADPERPILEHELLLPLVAQALAEAEITAKEIDSAYFTAPTPATRQLGLSVLAASRLGMTCRGQLAEVSNLGITGGLAFDLALGDVLAGRADVAVALGVEASSAAPLSLMMERGIRAVGDVDFQAPFGLTPIAWYAFDAARYQHEFGVTRADLAAVAVKSRGFAAHNPIAQFRKPLDIDAVLAQRPIVEPLGLLEVSGRGDGAICLVVANAERSRAPRVLVEGRGFAHDGHHQIGSAPHDMLAFPAPAQAARAALAQSRLTLADLQLAELYAPCTITEVLVSEALGICARGHGAGAAADGETALGGRFPINSSGGCLSRGHPPSLTGLYGLHELREQLLGRAGARQVAGATRALHLCELGNYNAALAHVLVRDD